MHGRTGQIDQLPNQTQYVRITWDWLGLAGIGWLNWLDWFGLVWIGLDWLVGLDCKIYTSLKNGLVRHGRCGCVYCWPNDKICMFGQAAGNDN
jgi:hypothetical protein